MSFGQSLLPGANDHTWPVCGLDPDRGVHRKPAALCPLRHVVRVITLEQTAAHKALQESPTHGGLQRL
jgi:hypothetical protein